MEKPATVPITIRPALPADAGLVIGFIRKLADYEQLLHEVVASEADIRRDLFGAQPKVFADIAEWVLRRVEAP